MEMSIKRSESLDKIGAALVKAQGEMVDPVKDTKGFGYKYAKLDQIIKIIRPILHKYGLSYTIFPGEYRENQRVLSEAQDDSRDRGKTPKTLYLVGIQSLTGMLIHESGQYMEGTIQLPVEWSKGMSLLQSIGSAITYGRRYLLSSVTGIQADEDIDGHVEEVPVRMQKPATQAPTIDQVNKLKKEMLDLIKSKGVTEDKIAEWKTKGNVSNLLDLPATTMEAIIKMLKAKG